MKRRTLTLLLAATISALAQTATPRPSEPPQPSPRLADESPMVRIDVLMVSLPDDKALQLLPDLNDRDKVVAAQARLLELVAQKQATLLGWPHITTMSGNRASSDTIVLERYPVGDSPMLARIPKPGLEGAVPVDPFDSETQNTGPSLEVDPVVDLQSRTIAIQLAPKLVRLIREKEFHAGTNAKGEKIILKYPIFDEQKTSTNITLHDGERMLLYVGKSVELGSPVVLFIVGAKIIPVASPK